ncbi:MAG: hypothetical protein J6Q85_03990 [Clostridia bacterium]|nr:hypothetical protein [Clostridia bacterium]
MKENNRATEKYFAAANGYTGFVSYFDEVFNPREYERIFVLKGGPGTGKSSFMRKIKNALSNTQCKIEEIFCSSDPKSLDGIICTAENKKIALLDGTSPHERDAKIPGAVDSIINLGDNWDEEWLRGYRNEILSLSKEKRDAYATAYFYLRLAGVAAEEIKRCETSYCNIKNLKTKAKSLAEKVSASGNGKTKTRLISSFGRYGEYKLDTFLSPENSVFSPVGREGEKALFMRALYGYLCEREADMTVCPSPLDKDVIEAIYLSESRTLFTVAEVGESVELSEKPSHSQEVLMEGVRCANTIRHDAMLEAERWFSIASDLHFRLEKIYTRAMNFEKNEELYTKCLDKILKSLA